MNRWSRPAAYRSLVAVALLALVSAPRAEAQNVGFVTAQDGQFMLNGGPFRFVGTNAYFLLDAANYGSFTHTTEMLALANELGFTVLRAAAYMDGTGSTGGFQTSLGVYDESTAQQLDWILWQANLQGVRVILMLTDYWASYGGMSWYVSQCIRRGASVDLFYTDSCARDYYKQWVSFLVNRPNTYSPPDSEPRTADNPNGYRRYKNDPTIFSWELANEPRSGDPTGDTVYNWIHEMAAYIKSLDSNHMVDTGEEGFDTTTAGYTVGVYNNQSYLFDGGEGVSFSRNTADPNIDFASAHLYPEFWNFSFDAGNNWIADHLSIARSLGKPFLLGEFGVSSGAVSAEADRAAIMKGWLDTWEGLSGAGALVFEVICQACTNYGGGMATVYPPATTTSDTLAAAAALANAAAGGGTIPTPPTLTLLTPSNVIAGGPDFTLAVSGMNFDATPVILWTADTATMELSAVAGGNGDLIATVPASLVTSPVTVIVAVRNGSGAVSNSLEFGVIPPPVEACPIGQFKAEYFPNTTLSGTPALTVCETQISHDWGTGGPGFGLPKDNFSVRWTGTFSFAARLYTFSATADDGVRLWVDGTRLIDAWKDQVATTYKARRRVSAGQHEVKVEYYERGGGATVSVGW